ncbi:biotin/lipoyl-binding protein [Halanaerobaculum tunisiense]
MAPQVGGKIKDLKVEIGDRVNEGELLVELDHNKLN